MDFGVCLLSLVPLRAEPSDASELVSQLLFGEYYHILDRAGNWIFIRGCYDSYEGWISLKQHQQADATDAMEFASPQCRVTTELFQLLENADGSPAFPLVKGSMIPPTDNGYFKLGKKDFIFRGETLPFVPVAEGRLMTEHAYHYLNAPYLWGGRGPLGIDCSGLTQIVARLCGIPLSRDAFQQVQYGSDVSFVGEALPGDLAFFENDEGRIVHTGILINNQRIIHASGKVRIDDIDHEGIYNRERGRYTHKLRLIRRIVA